MTQLTDDLITFEVPEGAAGFEIDNPLSPGDLVYYLGFPSIFNFRKVSLPPGSWQFICTTKEVRAMHAPALFGHAMISDYYAQMTTNALLTSKGLDVNKNYALLKKGGAT